MKQLLALICACVMLLGISANAQTLNRAVHNGSLMTVFASKPHVEIRYAVPRPGLWFVGVRPGTLLVEGEWRGPTLFAVAFVFAEGCPPIPYQVTGSVSAGAVLTLQGPAPIVDPWSCSVIAMGWTYNSTLVFIPN